MRSLLYFFVFLFLTNPALADGSNFFVEFQGGAEVDSEAESVRVDYSLELTRKAALWAQHKLRKTKGNSYQVLVLLTGDEAKDRELRSFAALVAGGETRIIHFFERPDNWEQIERAGERSYKFKQSKEYKALRRNSTMISVLSSSTLGAVTVLGATQDVLQASLVGIGSGLLYGSLQYGRDILFKFNTRKGLSGFKAPNVFAAEKSSVIENFSKQTGTTVLTTSLVSLLQASVGATTGFNWAQIIEVALKNTSAYFNFNRAINKITHDAHIDGRDAVDIERVRLKLSLMTQLTFQLVTFAEFLGFRYADLGWGALAASGTIGYYGLKNMPLRKLTTHFESLLKATHQNIASAKAKTHRIYRHLKCRYIW